MIECHQCLRINKKNNFHPMDVSNFDITTNNPTQNDILSIEIKFVDLDEKRFKLILLSIVGILDYKDEEIMFLKSIPVVLTILNTVKDLDQTSKILYYLPKSIPPSYRSQNFEISYHLVLEVTCDDGKYISLQRKFDVYDNIYEFFDIEQMIIIPEEFCQFRFNSDFRKEYFHMIANKMKSLENGPDSFIHMDKEKKLSCLSSIIAESKILEKYKDYRYNNCLTQYLQENDITYPYNRSFSIRDGKKLMCEIKVDDILYVDTANTIKFLFLDNIKDVKIQVYFTEKETRYGTKHEEKIYSDNVNVDYCVEKNYLLRFDNLKLFTLACTHFVTSFFIRLSIDGHKFEIPIKLYKYKFV